VVLGVLDDFELDDFELDDFDELEDDAELFDFAFAFDEPDDEPVLVLGVAVDPLATGSVGRSRTMKPFWLVWSPVRLKLNVLGEVI
jgi:hypothetical protein